MFEPSREQVRRFFIDAWAKHREARPLEPLEAMAVDHVLRHPEYHRVLEEAEHNLERDWLPEMGETNPFLHLSLHLSISEQLSVDQPPGVKAAYARLVSRLGDAHGAQHEAMDCLAEMLWQAQRSGQTPDARAYLECVERKVR
jgi:Domain of unknown function (DUF1841)